MLPIGWRRQKVRGGSKHERLPGEARIDLARSGFEISAVTGYQRGRFEGEASKLTVEHRAPGGDEQVVAPCRLNQGWPWREGKGGVQRKRGHDPVAGQV